MSAKDLAARAAAVGARRQKAESGQQPPAPAPVRTKPVRLSLDVTPNAYRDLTGYCSEIAAQAGKARVAHTLVMRKLLEKLQADDNLRADITAEVIAELRDK